MLCIGEHRKKSWTAPWRHTQVFRLKCEAQLQFFCFEITTEYLIDRFSEREMWDDFEEIFPVTEYTFCAPIVRLETWIHFF